MANTFSTTYKPTIASQKATKPRVKIIAFGNGYKQIVGDGINNLMEHWNLTWIVGDTGKQYIEDFFLTEAGYNYFNWTSNENGATLKQYICPQWNIQPIGNDNYQISASFEEWAGLT